MFSKILWTACSKYDNHIGTIMGPIRPFDEHGNLHIDLQ